MIRPGLAAVCVGLLFAAAAAAFEPLPKIKYPSFNPLLTRQYVYDRDRIDLGKEGHPHHPHIKGMPVSVYPPPLAATCPHCGHDPAACPTCRPCGTCPTPGAQHCERCRVMCQECRAKCQECAGPRTRWSSLLEFPSLGRQPLAAAGRCADCGAPKRGDACTACRAPKRGDACTACRAPKRADACTACGGNGLSRCWDRFVKWFCYQPGPRCCKGYPSPYQPSLNHYLPCEPQTAPRPLCAPGGAGCGACDACARGKVRGWNTRPCEPCGESGFQLLGRLRGLWGSDRSRACPDSDPPTAGPVIHHPVPPRIPVPAAVPEVEPLPAPKSAPQASAPAKVGPRSPYVSTGTYLRHEAELEMDRPRYLNYPSPPSSR